MKTIYTESEKCRSCGKQLTAIFDLGIQSLTGIFPRTKNEIKKEGPVNLMGCFSGCGLVQLKQSYSADHMYGENYGYRSSLNSSMVSHLSSKINNLLKQYEVNKGDTIIDIGSNDGTTLSMYEKGRYNLYGVDPTAKKFKEYYRDDIHIIADFFSKENLEINHIHTAHLVTSFSMFYDLENPIGFAQEVSSILHKKRGIWVTEQSYLPTMLEKNSFDTICHEHIEYYTLNDMIYIAKQANLKLIDVELNSINGGSFSCVFSRIESPLESNISKINKLLEKEKILDLKNPEIYSNFAESVNIEKEKALRFFESVKNKNQKVFGLGASTKGNVLLQYYGIGINELELIAEVNSDKFGSFTPGTLIPIQSEEDAFLKEPDYLFVLPWHFKDFFLSNPKYKGKKLVFPLPNFEIINL